MCVANLMAETGVLSATKSKLELASEFTIPTRDMWRVAAEAKLRGGDYDELLRWSSEDGQRREPIYNAEDVEPGFVGPIAGTEGVWRIEQECHASSAREANEFFLDGLAGGVTGLRWIPGDDAAIGSLEDLRIAFANVDLAAQQIVVEAGATAPAVLAIFVALARERGVAAAALRGGIFGRAGTAAAAWLAENAPAVRCVSVAAPEARAVSSDGIGRMLAGAASELRTLIGAGLSSDAAAERIAFRMPTSTHVLGGIATLRAARVLWRHVAQAFGVTSAARHMQLHVVAKRGQSGDASDSVRSAIAAFVSVLGGCDSLAVEPSAALGQDAERLARNQQLLLLEEAGLGRVADPLAGSYAVEALTKQIARAAWRTVQAIESERRVAANTGAAPADANRFAEAVDSASQGALTADLSEILSGGPEGTGS